MTNDELKGNVNWQTNFYIEVAFPANGSQKTELLSAILNGYGFEGIEELPHSLKGYIRADLFNANNLASYFNRFDDLRGIQFVHRKVPNKNWNEAWEKSYEPVTIASKVRIRASFHKIDKQIPYDILIDPKMSFGTGHHATTQLMIEMMIGMDFRGKSVLDFGSGTGVLSILAHKMKAKSVIAVDIDQWAFENMKENIRINQAENIEARMGDAGAIGVDKSDIILANVNKNIISENMELLVCALIRRGIILFSGLLENDETAIVNSAWSNGLILKEKKTKNGWLCLKFATR